MLIGHGGLIGAAGVASGGADPAFGAVSNVYQSGGTTVASGQVTLANVAIGDLVLVLVQRDAASAITGVTLGSQSLTQLKLVDGGSFFYFMVYGGLAESASASETITASFSGSAAWMTLSAARWSGVESATPLASSCNDTDCVGLTTAATTRTAQQITTSERALIIGCGCDWNLYLTHTAANGYTKRLDNVVAGGSNSSVQWIHDKMGDAGNYLGASNCSTASSDDYLSVGLAFA